MSALELSSSIASTLMSTVVAVVALIFSYRQNIGWKPVVLVTDTMLSGTGGKWHHTLHLSVEVWNRHKFPVAVRSAQAEISGVNVLNAHPKGPEHRDFVRANSAYKKLNFMVEPNGSKEIKFEVTFENQSLDALRPKFCITISYFNPHKNSDETLTLDHKFFYPELGWAKSGEQRAAALKVFEEIAKGNEALREATREKEQLRAIATAMPQGEAKFDPAD